MNGATWHSGVFRRARTGGAVVLALVLTALAPGGAWAGVLTCLTGTDPSVAADAAQIAAVRALLNQACPCESFDGSRGLTHRSYLSCTNLAINDQIALGHLRRQCKATVRKYCAKSICGEPVGRGVVPCVKQGSLARVTCAIKPLARCVDLPGRYKQTACTGFSFCIEAADTNGDGIIDRTDTGTCSTRLPTPFSTKTPPRTATPTRTPSVTPSRTATASATKTSTLTAAATATSTNTSTATPTQTPTAPPPATPTMTSTAPPSDTPTETPTQTPTDTPAPTATNTPGPCAGKADGTTCDAGGMNGVVRTCEMGVCGVCVPAGRCSTTTATACAFDADCPAGERCDFATSPSPRYVDNGDGTITDRKLCLVWEKKDQAGGMHDWSTRYRWACLDAGTTNLCQPTMEAAAACAAGTGSGSTVGCAQCVVTTSCGTYKTIWEFQLAVNSGTGFAGHQDWRLPTSGGNPAGSSGYPAELESILAAQYPSCTSSPCVDPAFNTNCTAGCSATGATPCSCTQPNLYWSATTNAGNTGNAWRVNFSNGFVNSLSKPNIFWVRAVRGGL